MSQDPPPTVEQSLANLVDVLWEIEGHLKEIRRSLGLPDSVKQDQWRQKNKRWNQ